MIEFHDFYQRYATDVYRFSLWLCGDPVEAEDLTSETFVRALVTFKELEMQTVKGYLFAIARNLYIRQAKRNRLFQPLNSSFQDLAPSPAKTAEDRADLDRVCENLLALPESDRTALLLRIYEKLPYEEIARILNISVSAAKVKVYRSRIKLSIALHKEEIR